MIGSTNHLGTPTLFADVDVKSGVPVYLSDYLAAVPQADAKRDANGKAKFAGRIYGSTVKVSIKGIAADAGKYQPVCVEADGDVVISPPGAGKAFLGVTNEDIAVADGATQMIEVIIRSL